MEIIMQPGAELHGTLNKNHGYYIQCRNGRFFAVHKANLWTYPPTGFLEFIRCLTRMAGCPIVADIIISEGDLTYALLKAGDRGYKFNCPPLVLHAEDVRAILEERNLL